MLLQNAEQYGLYVAEALASPSVDMKDRDRGQIMLNGSFGNISKCSEIVMFPSLQAHNVFTFKRMSLFRNKIALYLTQSWQYSL